MEHHSKAASYHNDFASSSQASSSESPPDVFINFFDYKTDSQDVSTFAGKLCSRFESSELKVFLHNFGSDDKISSETETAIYAATVHVTILTPNYMQSKTGMDELLLMFKSYKEFNTTIFPVFYDTQPSEPNWTSENGAYANALSHVIQKSDFVLDKGHMIHKGERKLLNKLVESVSKHLSPGSLVFINFCNYKICSRDAYKFATDLRSRFESSQLQVFLDIPDMRDLLYDQLIPPKIEDLILAARVHIAILTPNYIESRWNLGELVLMIKCIRSRIKPRTIFLPVFYDIQPSEVRWTGKHKNGPYAKALKNHEEKQVCNEQTIKDWRDALSYVAEISGFILDDQIRGEEELLKKIVDSVFKRFPDVYDVFLNHRGPDVKNFVNALYDSLVSHGYRVCLDKEEFLGGLKIPNQIEVGIQSAPVSIAIFSPRYAESEWCLQELVLMLRSKNTILPVFHKVRSSDLQRPTDGVYAKAFTKHKFSLRYDLQKQENWRDALSKVAELPGPELDGNDEEVLKNVVERLKETLAMRSKDIRSSEIRSVTESILKEDDPKPSDSVFQAAGQPFQTPNDHGMHENITAQQYISRTYHVPMLGLENPVNAVKNILLQSDVNVVVVTGMVGSGKTTLAKALCNDGQVRDFFQKNVFFIRDFSEHLLYRMKHAKYPPTLVVMDDVRFGSNVEQSLFEVKEHKTIKTILTTREDSTIPESSDARLYKMRPLEEGNALSLFCFWAFGQLSIPATEEEDLVKQVAAQCMGLPLALRVIGSCLHTEPPPSWESAREKLSTAESIAVSTSEYYIVLHRLQMIIDILDDQIKECFVDLGAFPQGGEFRVDSLLDIWVYVRGIERQKAIKYLFDLASRNLMNLTGVPSRAIEYNCTSELRFSQDDTMRDLALHLASQGSIIQRKRLFMPSKADNIPTEWLRTLTNKSSGAQFLSIHTGPIAEQDWCQIDFPNVEALVLFFTATEYCLPTFLHSMPKLKVLMLYNLEDHSRSAILPTAFSRLPNPAILRRPRSLRLSFTEIKSLLLPSFTEIKSLRLEGLIVSTLYDYCKSCESLKKLYARRCHGFGNMAQLDTEQVLELPKILEINLDQCRDLKDLPGKICNLTSLQSLSITGCYRIEELPHDFGMFKSLKVLRLSDNGLSMLPPSICQLQQLEFLDISLCYFLMGLPNKFNKLSKLEMLDMRNCHRLKKLPKTLANLRSLRCVVCDETTESQWRSLQTSAMPNLKIDSGRK